MSDARNRKQAIDTTGFLDPVVARALQRVHLRAENNRGCCGIVGTKDDPQLTEDPSLVTCSRCRGRHG